MVVHCVVVIIIEIIITRTSHPRIMIAIIFEILRYYMYNNNNNYNAVNYYVLTQWLSGALLPAEK